MMENTNKNLTPPYVIVLNSTVLFMMAYAFVYMFPLMATEYIANKSGVQTQFSNYKIEFLTPNESAIWTKDNIINIFAVGPAISFFLSFLFWYLAYEFRAAKGLFKLFFTWAYVISFNLTFGGLIAGIITKDGLFYVLNWSGLETGTALTLGIISSFILIFIGRASRVSFLRASYSRDWVMRVRQQIIFKSRIIYLPFIIGSLLFTLIGFPSNSLYDKLQLATMAVMFLPTMRYFNPDVIRITKSNTQQYVAIGFIIIFVIYFILFTLWVKL